MEQISWFLLTSSAVEFVRQVIRPLTILFILYYANFFFLLGRTLLIRYGFLSDGFDKNRGQPATPALVVLPTLLRKRGDLISLQHSIESVLANGYPGDLTVCIAIDDSGAAPALIRELSQWIQSRRCAPSVRLRVVLAPQRIGKAMAMELGIEEVRAMVRRGEIPAFPPIFFNLDADSELSEHALERLAFRLQTPRGLFGERPVIVASNVCVRRSHFWRGWRGFFSIPGQLSLQVAREYASAIGLGRHNSRLLPVTSVSGALYCTWSELHLQAPAFGRFLQTLRLRDWGRWWFGEPPPRLEGLALPGLPESTIGPGDDTWIAWLAMGARWRNGRVELELPETPWQALRDLVRSFLSRPVAYDPLARVYTSSPSTVRGLFRQRIRWNTARLWLCQRRGLSLFFSWNLAVPVLCDLFLTLSIHAAILASFLYWPFAQKPALWLGMLVLAHVTYAGVRLLATLLAMLQDRNVRRDWPLLLALPGSGLYHFVFNIVPTIVGLFDEIFLFGVNTQFAPEETLKKLGHGRVALAYRARRAITLATRALLAADVPFGAFWFGWEKTPWTTDGYEGWTTPKAKPAARLRRLGPATDLRAPESDALLIFSSNVSNVARLASGTPGAVQRAAESRRKRRLRKAAGR